MIYLSDRSEGRDNNLNLIRMVVAALVLVSHSVPIAVGRDRLEPLSGLLGFTLGTLSVYVFFAISGFLITASFERSSSRSSFVLARSLRIFPGLIVSLVFTAFVIGGIATVLSWGDYLTQSGPYRFVIQNTALFPLVFTLPGVFQELPVTGVTGSIWTLRFEVLCYAGVFLAGILGAWRNRWVASAVLLAYLPFWYWTYIVEPLPALLFRLPDLSMPFAIGTAFYIWRHRLPLTLWGVALTALLTWAVSDTVFYQPAMSLLLTYATFWLAYVPGGAIRAYNRLGDYSYGIYIYAFPVQGFAVWLLGDQTPWQNVLYSLPPTFLLAVLSWHLIEAPSLKAKKPIIERVKGERARIHAMARR